MNVLVFKSIVVQRLDLDETVSFLAYGETLIQTYERNSLDPPEYLTDAVRALRSEVASRRNERLEARLKEVDARRESLKPTAEKRADLDAESDRLRAQLGKAPLARSTGVTAQAQATPAAASRTEG